MEPITKPRERRAAGCACAVALGLLLLPLAARADKPLHHQARRHELLDGLTLERYQEPDLAEPITILRIDPASFELQLLTEQRYGRKRRPEEWIEDFDLIGVINAAMFQPNGRSTSMLLDDELVNNGYEHPAYEGYFAFGARRDGLVPFVSTGRDCQGFDLGQLRRDYRFLLQNYRLLDCDAKGIVWRDRRHYSVVALAHDEDGMIVWIHSASGQSASELAQWLSAPELRLSSALFAEGGPQAALVLEVGGRRIVELGHYEMSAPPVRSRPLPNVLGIRPHP
ncbi:MAG TPA: phosphodiester glycosidase family protein [Candidatus Krumholzibacteria bacterium]|jgi:hypothetical protein